MLRKIRNILGFVITLAIFFSLVPQVVKAAETTWSTTSLDGSIVATMTLKDDGSLVYSVKRDGNAVIDNSKLGIKTNVADFSTGMSFVSSKTETIDETYSLEYSKLDIHENRCVERELILSKNASELRIYFRVYDDGIAFRYYIPGSGAAVINSEYTEFNLPDGTGGWAYNWRNDYEGVYEYKTPTNFNGADFAMPVLASIHNNSYWMLLTEANVYNADGSFCASHLHGSTGQNMKVVFAPEQTSAVTTTYPFQTPYRVAIITSNLNDLTHSTLVDNLNPKTTLTDTAWVKPGQAAWSWWSEERSPQWYTRQKEYVDYAARFGWEYVTVDAGWDDSWIKPLCTYAKSKGVDILIWTDVDAIDTQEELDAKLTTWASWGISGIKVDFMMNDSQMRMNSYQLITKKCAELKLLVNFHGSTKPAGEIRTWPNIITSEGIRGSEHYKWSDTPTAYHNCTAPFTRNVIGPMDYTPTVFSRTNRNTTVGHQLALSVVYESGIQHFADSVNMYEAWVGTDFLRMLPEKWDDMKLLEGFPGDYATIARKRGNEWFIGSITNKARTANIPLDFLSEGTYTAYIYKDGASGDFLDVSQISVTNQSTLSIPLLATGGFAVRISTTEMTPLPSDGFTNYEAESSVNTLIGQARVSYNSNSSNGAKVGYLGNKAGSLVFNNIEVEEDGLYTMKVYYSTESTRDFYISVNNETGVKMQVLPSGSFNFVRTATITINLKKGSNTIRFYNDLAYAPDIDKIGIKKGGRVEGTTYEAESSSNTLAGNANVVSNSASSGNAKVGNMGNASGTLQFNKIYVEEDGTYLLKLYYLTKDNRNIYMSVNSANGKLVNCFDSGSFDALEYKEILVDLKAGENTIKFYNNEGWGPDIDRIVIEKWN